MPGPLGKLQDRISGLGIGKGVFSGPGVEIGSNTWTERGNGGGSRDTGVAAEAGGQELKSMD